MSIRVHLSPFLRKYVLNYQNDVGILLPTEHPISVEQIIAELHIPKQEVISIMVNGYPAKFSSIVNGGDSVTLAKVIGGG